MTLDVSAKDFAHVTKTLTLVADAIGPMGKNLPRSIVKNSGKSLDKLLRYMDNKTESSKEYFWMEGKALTYDFVRKTLILHQDDKASNDVVFRGLTSPDQRLIRN
ncbi:hypothetical protein FOL47_007676 [Perkinsus chesapeaki]|uniref:Uncharacterized protein n=1 Tax=Perkinsus chesapeaki TaxID=330153 RepID=A0A7J6LIX9_PERCH|nr:hypothetical protein FOL47_007676 [Perkinsus chesapeaki]